MKNNLIITLIAFLINLPLFGQVDAAYLKEKDTYRIQNKPKAVMAEITQDDLLQKVENGIVLIANPSDKSSFGKTKKLSKPVALKVIGYGKSLRTFHYNTYIVKYEDITYIIAADQVADNSILDAKNKAMDDYYAKLTDRLDFLNSEYDISMINKRAEIDRNLKRLKAEKTNIPHISDSVAAERIAEKQAKQAEEYNKWYSGLSASAKRASKLLTITEANLRSPNSAAGCDYKFSYINNSNKTIKYLTWNGVTYNAVNDRVACTIRRTSSFSGKDTGPVYPGAEGGGVWDCIIYNWSASELRLTGISIIYMDGSTASISGPDARAITGAPDKEISNYEITSLKRSIKQHYENDNSIETRKWTNRSLYCSYPEPYNEKNVRDYFNEEIILKQEIKEQQTKVSEFRKNNNILFIGVPPVRYNAISEKPSFYGGDIGTFEEWVNKHLVYPHEAGCAQGRVIVQFIVDETGHVGNVKVIRGIDPAFDAEVVRVISSSPKWTPGKMVGIVPVICTCSVSFN